MQKDGEPSVEDILRSIKQVISRDDQHAGEAGAGHTPPQPGMPGGIPRINTGAFTPRDPFARTGFPAPANSTDEGREDVYDLGALPAGEPDTASSDAPADEGSEEAESIELPAAFAPPHDSVDEANDDTATPEPDETPADWTGHVPDPEPATETSAPAEDGLISGAAAASLRDRLAALSSVSAASPAPQSPANPLEDMIRDMLRPMLKDWLDANLEPLIERIVSEEIARITGRR